MASSDPSQFVELLLRNQNDLLRFILPLVGHHQDAQDVLQETAKALWKKFDQFDTAQPFLPWAKQFARNEVLMHHRRRRRFVFLSEELIDQLVTQPMVDAVQEQRLAALQRCVEKLPDSDRRLLELRYSQSGATVQQLADEVGQTANMLYKALGRIRRALLECIDRSEALEQV